LAVPRSAYIHVPFCARRCGYCNFSVVADRADLVPAYLEALELELQQLAVPQPVETLFLGGGTPTQLAMGELDQLLSLVKRWFPCEGDFEFSVAVARRE
jgi:oxygen-independent coproporphyrinogen-3 oxidase